MLKNNYLGNSDVDNFIKWLANEIERPSLTHSYIKSDGSVLTFNGLADAFMKYDWPFNFTDPSGRTHHGYTFTQSANVLSVIASELNAHLHPNPINDQAVCNLACTIMMWGGVTNGNIAWLKINVSGLAKEIDTVRTILSGYDDSVGVLKPIRRFNAGMTKVYSLVVPDFIIYDSRVAAALTWLVAKWCKDAGKESVPELLAFPCMPPKEGDNPRRRKSRSPSCGDLFFPRMNGNVRRHAQWNLRASWILRDCLNRSSGTVFHTMSSNDLRALEAALFMLGYDLNNSSLLEEALDTISTEPSVTEDEQEPGIKVTQRQDGWEHSNTLGVQEKPFDWIFDIEKDSVVIDRGLQSNDEFTVSELFGLLHRLYDLFGYDWFPLANSVTKMPNQTEIDGLGSTLYSMSNDTTHAQAASQLGPIFMQYGVFEWNQKRRYIAWRMMETPPPIIDDLRMLLSQFSF